MADILPVPAWFARAVSGGRWLCPPHLLYAANALDRVRKGELKRLMIFMPPRHGKSELVSKYFPACLMRNHPDRRVILCSYEAEFAAHWGEQAKLVWEASGETFGASSLLRSWRSNWWITPEGGYMATAGVLGGITGKGMDVGIIDDPVKNAAEAYSETYRENVWNWYLSTFATRLEPGGAIILMMTRWHHDDLAGRLLRNQPGEWEVIRFPAIAEGPDALGRNEGEALWPERYDLKTLGAIRDSSVRWWNAMYQQTPLEAEGAVANREWFNVVDRLPSGEAEFVRSWDLAATVSGKADWLVGTKMAKIGGRFYVVDVARSRTAPADVLPRITTIASQDGKGVYITVEQEGGGSGKIVSAHIASQLAGYRVEFVRPTGDKVFRAIPFLDQAKAGNVFILRGDWNDAYLSELDTFPNGEHDDQVDTSAYAFGELAESRFVGVSIPWN